MPSYFGMGYLADDIYNRWPDSAAVRALEHRKQEILGSKQAHRCPERSVFRSVASKWMIAR